jgi:hypothetical protein
VAPPTADVAAEIEAFCDGRVFGRG